MQQRCRNNRPGRSRRDSSVPRRGACSNGGDAEAEAEASPARWAGFVAPGAFYKSTRNHAKPITCTDSSTAPMIVVRAFCPISTLDPADDARVRH